MMLKKHNRLHYSQTIQQSTFSFKLCLQGPHTFDIGEEEDEEDDFLAASWASSKTVCSDAFDFLFDEKNMNPENVLEKHPDVIEVKPDKDFGKPKSLQDGKVQQSKCCVIS